MARKKKAEEAVNTEGWLTTFADLISLLLCFFVMMYTASVPDDAKMQWILRSFADVSGNVVDFVIVEDDEPLGPAREDSTLVGPHIVDLGGDTPGIQGMLPMTWDDMYNWVSEIVDASEFSDSISVDMYQGRMHIRFDDDILFNAESAELLEHGARALGVIAPGIRAINDYIAGVDVQGHTAPAPPGTSRWGIENSWVLSSSRAANVTRYLDDVLRMVNHEKFRPMGYGGTNPHYPVETENHRNRRIELVLTRSDYSPDETPNILDMLQFDYLFPIIANGPLDRRQPSPGMRDRDKQILDEILEELGVGHEIFEAPPPTPGDGRDFDFSIPMLP
jgi:chemotaxis protein MotB